jgi:hypothetical protein
VAPQLLRQGSTEVRPGRSCSEEMVHAP